MAEWPEPFTVTLADGREVECTQVNRIEFANGAFTCGIAEGIDPDIVYLGIEKEGVEPVTLFVRRDEVSVIHCLLGQALWVHDMLGLDLRH